MLNNNKIGKNLLDLRKGLSMTQVEISNLLGASHQAVSKWEQGECLPDIEALLKIGRIFDKSVEEILLSEKVTNSAVTGQAVEPVIDSSDQPIVWEKALDEMKKQISTPSFNTWLKNTKAEYLDGVYLIYSPNNFTTEWLYQRYSPLIIQTLEGLTGESNFKVEFQPLDTTNRESEIIARRASLSF